MTDERATMILELQSAELEGRIPLIVAEEVSRLCKENERLKEEIEDGWRRAAEMDKAWGERARELLEKATRNLVLADTESGELFDEIHAFLDGEN